jgi:hypothetical protein
MYRMKPLTLLAVVVLAALSVGITWADSPAATAPAANTLQVNYFANANTAAPDGTVELTNSGSSAGATICAMIYVFEPDEELAECCGCTLTPNDLRTLSINTNLTNNPLTGGVLVGSGTISIVSATDTGVCNPTTVTPTPSTADWGTHILSVSTGGYVITETTFQNATLSGAELSNLEAECKAIVLDGSGHGICTCGGGS